MRASEHFNLNLVEGKDIVNPLVTDVPNYESIDAQMFKNQNAGVHNATELKTGTVHAITRLVPDAQMITFTATSNFVAGDTFTVDGIQVSALTVSGEQLPTGAYVINSQVLAILKGTLLTVYGVGSETADNALALNGHPDTYFGTKEDVDNAINTANAANELVNQINSSLVTKSSQLNVSSWGSSTVNEVKKSGNIVYVNFNMVRADLPLPLDYTLATIPAGFRPSSRLFNKEVTLRSTARGDVLTGFVNINTDGSIILVNIPSSEVNLNQMIINLSYIV